MVTSTNVLLSAYTSFLRHCCFVPLAPHLSVSMPSRAYTSFLHVSAGMSGRRDVCVNALSGLYLISTAADNNHNTTAADNVSMPSRANDSFLPARGVLNLIHRFVVKCQCPLGLMTHFYDEVYSLICFFEDNECQCPLGLMTHFYRDRGARAKRRKEFVSMPSRANDSFLRL